MNIEAEAGAEYGLSFISKKLEALPARTSAKILKPDGKEIETKTKMIYLGSLLSEDGSVTSLTTLYSLWTFRYLKICQQFGIFQPVEIFHSGIFQRVEIFCHEAWSCTNFIISYGLSGWYLGFRFGFID